MEYTVIRANNLDDLIKLINSNIERGWKPQGGLFALSGSVSVDFFQALIKE